MVMVSALLGCELFDARGGRARLRDCIADLAAGDYPTITTLLTREPGNGSRGSRAWLGIPWAAVADADWPARRLRVADLAAREAIPDEVLADSVLLKRDVLDALVLDLRARRAFRANDLRLIEEDGDLRLRAVDASVWGMLRRLGLRRPAHDADRRLPARHLHDWRYVEFMRGDPQAALAGRDYHRRVAAQPPGLIANLMEELPYLHAAELLALLPDASAAKALEAMAPERQHQVFDELDEARVGALLALMAPDVAADLLAELEPAEARRALERLPSGPRGRVVELLRYPPETVGGIMTNDVVALPGRLTVRQARQSLAALGRTPDFVYFLYVVDDEATRRLRGVLTLRELVVAGEGRRLEEIMSTALLTLDPLAAAKEGGAQVTDSHLAALPVLGDDGRLLGVVTVDAAVAVVAPEAWGAQAPRVFS